MEGFENSLDGADHHDVHGWALHIHKWFPDRRDVLDDVLHLPISEKLRQATLRQTVLRQIAGIVQGATERDAGTSVGLLEPRHDPANKAANTLLNIGDRALALTAERKGISVAQLQEELMQRFVRAYATG